MTLRIRRVVFALLCALQLGAAARGVVRYERTLADGKVVLFPCAPLDPADPFRGRYVQLSFTLTPSSVKVLGEPITGYNEPGYAVLHTDGNGFAIIDYVSKTRPGEGQFVKVKLSTYGPDTTSITPLFDRYYMAEELAPAAEQAYLETAIRFRNTADAQRSYAIVRILDGVAVLEGVMLGGEPIEEVARRKR